MPDESKPTIEEGIKSPFVPDMSPKATFDYDKYQDETTVKAYAEILKCIGNNANILAFPHDADQNTIVDSNSKVAQEILNILMDCKVPDTDLKKVSESLSHIIYSLFSIVSRQKLEFERELLARTIGVKDPGTNKYSREYAGLTDMFNALIKVREQQGNNSEDYFFVKKESPEDEVEQKNML